MRKRTKGREFALQALYQIDITKDNARDCLEDFWKNHERESEASVKEFTENLVFGFATSSK